MLTKAEVHRLRMLREKKHREALGLFVVEGEKVVGELIDAGFPLLEIYATETWNPARPVPETLRVTRISEPEMARVSHFPTPAPVLAIGQITRNSLAAGDLDQGLTLALDGVQDAGNVGTLIRIADWFGLDRLLLSPDCADVFNQKVINASMGSFAHVPVYVTGLPDALASVRAGVPILGCDLRGTDVSKVKPLSRGIIVIGSEGRGLSSDVAAKLTDRVTIPRRGRAESLNAAIAAGIVCAYVVGPQN